MVGKYFIVLAVFVAACIAADAPYTVKIINNVAPCSNGNYSTISLFISPSQYIMAQGTSYTVQSSQIDIYTGLGIQENGQYCHYNGTEAGCYDPDNAGMQLWITKGDCSKYSLADPFYCGQHPPNAKTIVNVAMSGTWPDCVATLTRLPNAPLCVYSCTGTSAASTTSKTTTTTTTSSKTTTTTTTATSSTSGAKTTTTTTTGSKTSTTTTATNTGTTSSSSPSLTTSSKSTSSSPSSPTTSQSPSGASTATTSPITPNGPTGTISASTTDVEGSASLLQFSNLCAMLVVLFYLLN